MSVPAVEVVSVALSRHPTSKSETRKQCAAFSLPGLRDPETAVCLVMQGIK